MKRGMVVLLGSLLFFMCVGNVHAQQSDDWWLDPNNQNVQGGGTSDDTALPVTADAGPTALLSGLGMIVFTGGYVLYRRSRLIVG